MANDLMRTGPRGSSNQEAWVGPTQVFITAAGAAFDASAGAQTGSSVALWGCNWRVAGVRIQVVEVFGAASGNIDIGTTGTTDAYVNNFIIPNGTAAGAILDVPLSGTNLETDASELRPFLVSNAGGSGGTGTFFVYLLAYPVSGGQFFNG